MEEELVDGNARLAVTEPCGFSKAQAVWSCEADLLNRWGVSVGSGMNGPGVAGN